jgi:hypothetical protein
MTRMKSQTLLLLAAVAAFVYLHNKKTNETASKAKDVTPGGDEAYAKAHPS